LLSYAFHFSSCIWRRITFTTTLRNSWMNAYKILARETEGKIPFDGHSWRREDNIKMDGFAGSKMWGSRLDSSGWRQQPLGTVVNMVMNLLVSAKTGTFLTSWTTASSSRMILLYLVRISEFNSHQVCNFYKVFVTIRQVILLYVILRFDSRMRFNWNVCLLSCMWKCVIVSETSNK
jgi:hypothetical protein